MSSPLRLAVLVSGSGTTLQNLLDRSAAGAMDVAIVSVVGSRSDLAGVRRAVAAGVPTTVVDRRAYGDSAAFSRRVFEAVDAAGIDLVCLGGWLHLLEVPARYAGRVMNIHPSLLPSFGGRGMYGRRVHQAVLDRGCKVSGCTVHLVDNEYDAGPILVQRTCPVADDDTAESLAARVFEQECGAYPEAIALFRTGRLTVDGRRVRVSADPG